MLEPIVSIIIPLYNSQNYIRETIECCLNQSYKNIETIVVNDGSSDDGLRICQEIKHDRLKILSQANKGASAARNTGLREAKGDYIQFLDADDLISSNKISDQISTLLINPHKIAVCPTVYFFDGEYPFLKSIDHTWIKDSLDEPLIFLLKLYGGEVVGPNYGGMVTVHSWLTPRKIIETAGYWNESLSVDDDGEYFCRAVLGSEGIVYSPNAVSYYRKYIKTKFNLSSKTNNEGYTSVLSSLELKANHLKAKIESSDRDALFTYYKKAFALNYFRLAVSSYPSFPDVYKEALKRVEELGGTEHNPVIGGMIVECIKKMLGWKAAKTISYMVKRMKFYQS